ncbi:response regulator [uncultured Sulfuricurvum sp.]|uniref:response regulator n=2 Tax=Sulfuricurvum TaxID=286130 RepID=UPI002630E230|nr:response regulator [uncultured Sulfuricurvum sp.]
MLSSIIPEERDFPVKHSEKNTMMSDEMHTLSPKEQLKLTLKHDDPTYRYYKSIFHLTDGMIAVIDGERIIDANKAFIDFFATISLDVFDPAFRLDNYFLHIDKYGYVYEGYLNRRWYENVLSHEKEHYKVGISGVEKIFTFSISVTPLDSTHQVYVITLSDVTDMMSYKCVLEEGLKTSNYEKAHTQYVLDQYNQAIDISNLVARCDLNGTITYVNDSLCRTLHYRMEELVGENVAILFESDNDAMCKHISWENLKSGGVWKGVLKNVGKKGEPHYFATTIIPIKNQENEVIEILSIRHEITEMVKAKEEALLLLEAKTKFFDQVSHELRTPLNAILNFTDQALESYDEILDDELTRKTVKQYLERAYKNLSVLYAEDDMTLREITEKTLQLVVGKVYAVSDGEEALNIYKTNPVDIVILDIYMGSLNGIEVAKKIREVNDKVPIVIVSGSIATEDLLAACKLNLVDYIRKPIEFNELIKVLYSAVDRLKTHGLLLAKINDTVSYDYFAKSFIRKDGEKTALTKNEIHAIELLLSNRGQIIPYETFSQVLDEEMSDGALKNLILRLRKKMGDDTAIRNLAKIGYTLF